DLTHFNAKGESVRKALMKTPIDGARLSSRFGKRKHPILGYTKVHAGVDFAAPTGTPVYAAGDGTILEARRKGAYGNYVQIRHNSSYSTAYAHLNAFARGVRKGKRVRQGQVIAYVGTTGRSTGPHLHYEVIRNGKRVNPINYFFNELTPAEYDALVKAAASSNQSFD
ncbi:MAG: M23 family metallopeptidase, partial [Flavobacteriia bacterium]|nr:M23 family metallopeptidase [Flavobacteriia bacterium]